MIIDFLEFTSIKPCFARPFSGVQLLPRQYNSYVVPIEAYNTIPIYDAIVQAYIVDVFGNETNISNSAKIQEGNLFLTNINYDLDRRCVIKIGLRDSNAKTHYFYSNIIKISSVKSERTMLVSYKCDNGTMYNIQLQAFEMHSKRSAELETYTQTSTNNQVSFMPFNVKYYAINICTMWIETLNKLIDVFKNDSVYFDYEQVNLFAIPEIEDLEQDIYITQARFEVTKLGVTLSSDLFLATDGQDYIVTDKEEKIKINK